MCETGRRTPMCIGQSSAKAPSVAFAKLKRQRSPDIRLADCHVDPDKVKMWKTLKSVFPLGKRVAVRSYIDTLYFPRQNKPERGSVVS